ncbi:MAG TPA: hypothetical protein VJB59_13220 [Bdellovibrionota bacterium]|nr:hypothetical protein [Bdellovibrionota bacterium]
MKDELSKEEQEFSQSLANVRFLVADPSSSRKSFRALLSYFKVKPHLVDVVDSAHDSTEVLKKNKHNVIFADYSLGGSHCFELIQVQQDVLSPEEVRAFFLITSQDSNSLVSSAADESVDAIFVKPFNFGILKQRFIEVLSQKIDPSPYTKAIKQGRRELKMEKPEEAIKSFQQAKKLDPAPALACSYEGEAHQMLKHHPEAIRSFEEGLSYNPTHFRSLLGAVESFMETEDYEKAYAAGRKLVDHHTVPVKRIPQLIRLSVLNQKFEDVVQFYEVTSRLDQSDDTLATYLGAGLVICGLYFLRKGANTSALDAFRKAEVACKQQPRILTRILRALITAGLEAEMKAFLSRIPDEVKDSAEVRLAQIEFWARSGSQHKALEYALKMIQENIKDEKLFEWAIRISKDLKRKDTLIEDLVFKAGQAFPDKRAFFEGMK